MSKIVRTTAAGGVGFLAGLLLERGLESLTGLDFVDGLFAVSGSVLAALSVNRDLVKAAARNIEQMFGKDPLEISEGEWRQFKELNPKTAEWLEKALKI
ncbi:MAG TPA: hypothetical protein GX008_04230 [Firmicutes bacterium]|nr:MAG: hypothetical protein AA931_05480 [Peptococcaceae bacterium 1109]HHT72903.1 hypothetical protein [Bacillota bacterium]